MSTETLSRDRRIFVRWDKKFHDRLKHAAIDAKMTLAEFIYRAVEEKLERLEKEQALEETNKHLQSLGTMEVRHGEEVKAK